MGGETCFTGGCSCGMVRYRGTGPVTNLCFCHCSSCRRAVGATPVPWATFAGQQFAIVRGQLAEFRSSAKVTRGFCADCGTSLTYRHDKRPDEMDVALVTLDEPNALVPEAHIWVQDKLEWIRIPDGQAQFAGYRIDNQVNS